VAGAASTGVRPRPGVQGVSERRYAQDSSAPLTREWKLDPRSYWRALVASWPLVVAAALLGAVAAYGWAQTQSDVYRATSSVFVSTTPGEDTSQLVQGSTYAQSQLQSYTRLATTPSVLGPVIGELGLDVTPAQLARVVEAENPLSTVIIDVTVSDESASGAADIANAVSRSLQEQARELSPESLDGSSALSLRVVAVAAPPAQPASPNRRLVTLTGAAAGGALGVAAALLRSVLDTRLRTRRDLEELDVAPLLGTVARHDERSVLDHEPRSRAADDHRRVRAVLLAAGDGTAPAVLTVTSPADTTASVSPSLDLALAAAERDVRVLVVDADPAGSGVTAATGTGQHDGLVEVAAGRVPLDQAVTAWRPRVDVLSAGAAAVGSADGPAVEAVLDEARRVWDLVVVAAPPVLTSPATLDLAVASDGVVIVATAGRTTRQQLQRSVVALQGVHATVLGVVLDGVRPERSRGGRSGGADLTEREVDIAAGWDSRRRRTTDQAR
jgi:capsular polysaccharide biosynthesis protein